MGRLRSWIPLLAFAFAWVGLGTAVVRSAHWASHSMLPSADTHCLACEMAWEPVVAPGAVIAALPASPTLPVPKPSPGLAAPVVCHGPAHLPGLRAPPIPSA